MMDPKSIQRGALIELRDTETNQWLPLTIISVVFDKVECRTLANEPIFTTTSALIMDARLRPQRESHKQALYQLVEHFVGDMRGTIFKEKLVDEILRVNDRFNSNPSLDEALNSGDGSYKP